MEEYVHIDIAKSIRTGYLNIRRDWLDTLMQWTLVLICIGAIFFGYMALIYTSVAGIFSGLLAYVVSPVCILFGAYSIYRIANRNRLNRVTTNLSPQKAHVLLRQFLYKRRYHIYHDSPTLVIATESMGRASDNKWKEVMTFIIDGNNIYLNVAKDYPSGNPPVFFSHIMLKKDVLKYIKRNAEVEANRVA